VAVLYAGWMLFLPDGQCQSTEGLLAVPMAEWDHCFVPPVAVCCGCIRWSKQ